MKGKFALLILAAVGLALACGTPALAQGNCCGGGGGYGGYGGWFGAVNPYTPTDRRIPYFAQHPPVYYSYPVPRTYGYSPFPYPGTFRTPEVAVAPEPMMVPNPHVPTPAKATAEDGDDKLTSDDRYVEPLVISNPYVGGAKVASTRNRE